MKRKILCLILGWFLLLGTFAVADSDATVDPEKMNEDFLIVVNAENPSVAVCGLEKNADVHCYPASTTKILTCIIALEEGDLDQKITVPSAADSDRVAGTTMGIHKKEVYTLRDLLYGMMLPSGNDAAIAIATGLSGKIDAFAERMNAKAAEIGMDDSHFVNPNGLQNEEHYSTARDMAILAAYAMQNETFREIVSTVQYTAVSSEGRRVTVQTTNRYLRDYRSSNYKPESVLWSDAIGIKTGETNHAGKCFVAAAERNGTVYIAALFRGDMPPSSASQKKQDSYSTVRYKDARTLLEYAFEHDLKTVSVTDLIANDLPTDLVTEHDPNTDGILSSAYSVEWDRDASFTAPVYSFPKELLTEPFPADYVVTEWSEEPIAEGAVTGEMRVVIGDTEYFSAPIRCKQIVRPTPTPSPEPTLVPTPEPTEVPEITLSSVPVITPAPAPAATTAPLWPLSCAPQAVQP